MKKLLERIDVETLWGFVFGVIAIIAIIVEVVLNGLNASSIAGGVKDAAGTLVSVLVFIIAVKALVPKKEKLSFEERLDDALKCFVSNNSRMLFQKEADQGKADCYEIFMQSDFSCYFGEKSSLRPGWFMRMPIPDKATFKKGNINVLFQLNQGTFFGHLAPENEANAYAVLGNRIARAISGEYSDSELICLYKKAQKQIEVTIVKPISSNEDIEWFKNVIGKVYNAFLVLGDSGVRDEIK